MNVQKSDDFIGDLEHQFEWYVSQAGWDIAEQFLSAAEATCQLLARHPRLGPSGRFTHLRLGSWRFFLVSRPFHMHVFFYEVVCEGSCTAVVTSLVDFSNRPDEPLALTTWYRSAASSSRDWRS